MFEGMLEGSDHSMADALSNADLRNLFVAAKSYSSRSVVVELGRIAESFASRYAELDNAGKEAFRAEYPGLSGKRYAYGWLGQWARLLDSDAEVSGDAALSARTMVRYLKFHPIAEELVQRDRLDAVPVKLGASCSGLQRAIARIDPPHGPAPNETERKQIVHAVADAFEKASVQIGKPINASATHAAVLDSAIAQACADKQVDLGPVGEKKPRKRSRPEKEEKDASHDGLDSKIASLVEDSAIAREVSKRLSDMIPEVAKEVSRDLASDSAYTASATAAIAADTPNRVRAAVPGDPESSDPGEFGGDSGSDDALGEGDRLGAVDDVVDGEIVEGDANMGDGVSGPLNPPYPELSSRSP